jgi:hypothetical protein
MVSNPLGLHSSMAVLPAVLRILQRRCVLAKAAVQCSSCRCEGAVNWCAKVQRVGTPNQSLTACCSCVGMLMCKWTLTGSLEGALLLPSCMFGLCQHTAACVAASVRDGLTGSAGLQWGAESVVVVW